MLPNTGKRIKLFLYKIFHWNKQSVRVCLDTVYYWKLKTNCWKHYSKIIFKCVNSVMRLILKLNLRFSYLRILWTIYETQSRKHKRTKRHSYHCPNSHKVFTLVNEPLTWHYSDYTSGIIFFIIFFYNYFWFLNYGVDQGWPLACISALMERMFW